MPNHSLSASSVAALLAEAETVLKAHEVETARLDAEALLAYVLGMDRARLFARMTEAVPQPQQDTFQALVERRVRREPLAYITGVREFWSLEFQVTSEVLIPRPETELLVETVLHLLSQAPGPKPQAPSRLLDLCTGSGCIAIALAKESPEAEVWAIDISAAALAVAQANARRHGVIERVHFLQGNMLSFINKEKIRFDAIASNPPYIPALDLATLQPEVRQWEPATALNGGSDGLDFYRALIEEGPTYLRSGGCLVMELGAGQSPAVLCLLREQRNLMGEFGVRDYAGHERVVVAYKV